MKGIYEQHLSTVVPGEWAKVASKHYKHVSGVQVKYEHNHWRWQVIGGPMCGYAFDAKWAAQTEGVKHLG